MISDFLKSMGGPTRVAERLSEVTGERIERARVAMWGVGNNVPYRWRVLLIQMAHTDGVPVPSAVMEGVMVEHVEDSAA